MDAWISVKDRMPKVTEVVLICPGIHRTVSVGRALESFDAPWTWHDELEWVGEEGCHSAVEVLYWQPLPSAPQGVTIPEPPIYTVTSCMPGSVGVSFRPASA